MTKSSPYERWQENVFEGYDALRASPELLRLRRQGLRALGRKVMMSPNEWREIPIDFKLSPDYTAFREECRRVGADFGVNEWTVEMACLLRGYDARKAGLVVEARWPEVRVITGASDALFVDWL